MTIATTVNRVNYTGDGTTVTFAYPFEILLATDLQVYVTPSGGTAVQKTLTTDYTVSGVLAPPGGNVTFTVAPANQSTITIVRVEPFTQASSLPSNDKFPTSTVETALDKLTMITQQLTEVDGRCLKLALTSLLANITLPDLLAGGFLQVTADGLRVQWASIAPLTALNNPMTGVGDLIEGGAAGAPTRLAAPVGGGSFLGSVASVPTWRNTPNTLIDLLGAPTKGDIVVANVTPQLTRIAAGPDGTALVARAAAAMGVEYAKQGLAQGFHGLHLRTHPDADKAANQIALLNLKSAVMDDGTRYDDAVIAGTDAPLIADITVAGAGGLDTGARVASTWYEPYLVGKSSTKTKADLRLLLHRAKNYALDQNQTSAASGQGLNTASTNQQLAQTFTPTLSGVMEFADVNISRGGSPVGQIWLEVQADSAGVPSGTPLATSDRLDISKVSTSALWVRFPFRTPASLTATTKYWLVQKVTHATDAVNFTNWNYNAAGTNQFYQYNGTTWSAIANATAGYKTYITQNNTAVTMPAGYDQKCKLAAGVFNNSGNAFNAIAFKDRTGRPLATLAQALSSSATVPILFDASAIIPPGRLRVVGYVRSGAGAAAYNAFMAGVPDGFMITIAADPDGGQVRATLNSVGYQLSLGPFGTEFQGGYGALDAANTTAFYIQEWEW